MADENEPLPDSKLTRSKQRWAREGKFLRSNACRRGNISPGIGLSSISA